VGVGFISEMDGGGGSCGWISLDPVRFHGVTKGFLFVIIRVFVVGGWRSIWTGVVSILPLQLFDCTTEELDGDPSTALLPRCRLTPFVCVAFKNPSVAPFMLLQPQCVQTSSL